MRECKICIAGLILLALATVSIYSFAQQSRSELESKRENLLKEIEATTRKIEEARNTKQKASDQIAEIEKQIDNRNKLMANLCETIDQMDTKMVLANDNATVLQRELDRIKLDYTQVMQTAYRRHLNYSDYLMFLSSKSVNEFFSWWLYVKQFDYYSKEKIASILNNHKSLMDNIYTLETNKQKKLNLVKEQEHQQKLLAVEIDAKNKLLESMTQKENELIKKIKSKEDEKKKLDDKIEKIILKEIKEAEAKKAKALKSKSKETKTPVKKQTESKPAVLKDTPNDDPVSKSFAGNKGRFSWPVEKAVLLSGSGKHEHPTVKGVYVNNRGIVIKTTDKAGVKAIYEGVVSYVGNNAEFKDLILVKHGNYYTMYANLDKVSVKKGDLVKAKQVIGSVSYDNTYECPVLYFGIWNGEKQLSPESWLQDFK